MNHCPNLNGCREMVKQIETKDVYLFEADRARLRFDIPDGKDGWIVSFKSYLFMFSEICMILNILKINI